MDCSQHSTVVSACDSSEAADRRIARVLWNDAAGLQRCIIMAPPERSQRRR